MDVRERDSIGDRPGQGQLRPLESQPQPPLETQAQAQPTRTSTPSKTVTRKQADSQVRMGNTEGTSRRVHKEPMVWTYVPIG